MKIYYFTISILLLICRGAVAAETANFAPGCMPGAVWKYLSVAVVEQKGMAAETYISEIKRTISRRSSLYQSAAAANLSVRELTEDAVVTKKAKDETIKNIRFVSLLDESCRSNASYAVADMYHFGFYFSPPEIPAEIGQGWKGYVSLMTESGEVKLGVSYHLENIVAYLGRRAAVVSFMLSGTEDIEGGKSRWAGIGKALWYTDEPYPFLRYFEIKQGESFIDAPDRKISYAESAVF